MARRRPAASELDASRTDFCRARADGLAFQMLVERGAYVFGLDGSGVRTVVDRTAVEEDAVLGGQQDLGSPAGPERLRDLRPRVVHHGAREVGVVVKTYLVDGAVGSVRVDEDKIDLSLVGGFERLHPFEISP